MMLTNRLMILLLLVASATLLGCGGGDDSGRVDGDADTLSDGEWVLHVDRRWSGNSGSVQFPSDHLAEDDYELVDDGATYLVVFSSGQESVSVGDIPLLGELEVETNGKQEYDLTTGTFAGGRLVVWTGESGLQAELTIYGSGIPIVSSERGALVLR